MKGEERSREEKERERNIKVKVGKKDAHLSDSERDNTVDSIQYIDYIKYSKIQ